MKRILIIAGETSGDMHAGNLVKSIREKSKDIEFVGLGGKRMEKAGVKLFYNLVDVSVLGFLEVLKKYSTFKRIFKDAVKRLDSEKLDCVILVDYPGFNLRFAKEVKKRNIPLLYYISPQVWAWGKGRIGLIKRLVDKIIVLFKFEEKLYSQKGLDAEFVGHSLLDIVKPTLSDGECRKFFNLKEGKKTIALLPGSRRFEVEALLPIMKRTAEIIKKECSNVQFIVTRIPYLKKEIYQNVLKDSALDITLVENKTYDAISVSDLVIVKSGTATLETAILQKPMIITYKASFITYLLTRFLIKLPYIGLVNVIAGKKIVPEFLQYNARPHLIAREALDILNNAKRIDAMKASLKAVKQDLGESGANERASQAVLNFLAKLSG